MAAWIPMSIDLREDRMCVLLASCGFRRGLPRLQQSSNCGLATSTWPNTILSDFPKEGFTTQLRNYLDMTVASGEMQITCGCCSAPVCSCS